MASNIESLSVGDPVATIATTWPSGSTCTCTDGSKILIGGTSGSTTFNIPSTGDWIVSCTDGTETASETVSIVANTKSCELIYTPPDPPTDYESVLIATWNSSDDVDSFFNTYSWKKGWAGLKLGNLIQINDGTFNVQWEIAGFNLEHEATASDGTSYDNGYGICLIPKTQLTTYNWHSSYSSATPYTNSDIHSYINSTVYNALSSKCGSHIIQRNVLLGSRNTGTSPRSWVTSKYTWTTAYLTLMSIGQMTNSFAATCNKYDDGEANYYLPVFKHENYYTGSYFWSRCVYGYEDSFFCAWIVYGDGFVDYYSVNGANGVRPFMYLR